MALSGILYNIQKFAIHDGHGIRTTVFFKGCPLTCWWCHNPESRSAGIRCLNGQSIGQEYTVDALFEVLQQDVVFYEESDGGVTFSGGEPLSQPEFLAAILKKNKDAGIHTALDTSGYTNREVLLKIIPATDLFLFDLKLMDDEEHIRYTSVSNKSILENLTFLLQNEINTTIRIPLIPGITNTDKNLELILKFLKPFSPAPEIHLLPYHRTAKGKYEKFGISNHLAHVTTLPHKEVSKHLDLFESEGFKTTLGG